MARLPSKEKPVFADDIMISFIVKKEKDGGAKDAMVRISFVDSLRKEIISDVVISPITARALVQVLSKTNEKLKDSVSGKYQVKKSPEAETTYIG